MAHWFRNMRIRRRMHEVFRLPLPCDPRLAENRFSEARETARALYRRIVQAAPTPPGFVHPQWEENIREVESYFLEWFDMSFMAYPRINSTMVFTKHAAHEAEWPSVEAWRSPDTVRKYLRNGLNDHFLTGKIGIGTLINSTHQLYHLACFERFLLAFHDGWKPWSTEEMIGGLRERFGRVETVPLHFLPGNHYLQATGRIASGRNG